MKARADFYETFKGEMLASKKMKNRLIRYWGTETIDGVEVFKDTFPVWPGSESKEISMITNLFGMTQQIRSGSFNGLVQYYLKFNPDKQKKLLEYTKGIIANKINTYMNVGDTKTVTLNIYDPNDPAKFVNYSSADILNYVDDNYPTLLDDNYIEVRGDTILENTLGIYVLLDDGTHFKVTSEDGKVSPVEHRRPAPLYPNNYEVYYTTSISLTLTYTMLSAVSESSEVVEKIHIENEQLRVSKLKLLLESTSNETEEELLLETGVTTNAIWYKGQLRTSLTDSYTFKSKDFADIVASTLDTGYIKKKSKWWKKLIAPVLFIIAILAAPASAGASLAGFAAYMGVVALVLAGIQYAIAKSGDVATASYIGRFVQIAGIISTIAGIGAMISNLARTGFTTAVARTAAINVGVSAASQVAITGEVDIGDLAKSAAGGGSSVGGSITKAITEVSIVTFLSAALKVVIDLVTLRNNMKAKDVKHQISVIEAESEALAEELAEMEDKTLHIGVEDIKWYTSPLTLESTQHKVDYLYEGAGHNILRPSFYTARALNIRT